MLASQVVGILILSLFGCGNTYRRSRFYEDREYPSYPLNDNRAYRPRPFVPFYQDESPNPELAFHKQGSPYQPIPLYEEVGPSDEIEEIVSHSPDEEFRFADEDAPGKFVQECLNAHNRLRARHQNTRNLVWNRKLARSAKRWATKLALTGIFAHDDAVNKPNGWGENIYFMYAQRPATCAEAVLSWYKEIDDYDFNTGKNNTVGKDVGHFTQVVSTRSTYVGVGIATVRVPDTKFLKTYVVAKYTPFGNVHNQNSKFVNRLKPGEPRPKVAEDAFVF